MALIRNILFLLCLCASVRGIPLFAQAPISLSSEITRLERIAAGNNTQDSYKAHINLARLHRLSGNSEAALKSLDGALSVQGGDGRAFLEQARLLISLGEYNRAATALNALFVRTQDPELLLEGRYLTAMLEAFRANTRLLDDMAGDPAFAAYHSGIYYTLWRLSGLPAWRTRLGNEFPQSPEARIAANDGRAGIGPAASPLWLLYPGRQSISLVPGPQVTPSVAVRPNTASVAAMPNTQSSGVLLQTGVFGREENASAMAQRLRLAGFEAQIIQRQPNPNPQWAVVVPGGQDSNRTIQRLKDAGFESFPLR
ncbi:MAG: SPOR domain-containing protein [Treponema sp.]|nr:SPOR domain-containing protein [Treponema sp.]